MEDMTHSYESLHKEHHAWRKYLLEIRAKLNHRVEQVIEHQNNAQKQEVIVICKELVSRHQLFSQEVENKLNSLTDIDGLMSQTKETHHIVSSELFLLNSRMRAGILEFDKGCERFRDDVKQLIK